MKLRKPPRSQLKLWEKLRMAKYRHQEGLFLAEGFKVVRELANSTWESRAILVMENKYAQWEAFISTVPEGIDVFGLTEKEWSGLSQDKVPEGIMALAAVPPRAGVAELLARDAGFIVLLYQINNPNNLGAVLRTAHWFGIGTVVLSTGSVDFTNPKVVRSAMGSLFHVTVIPDIDFLSALPVIRERYFLVGSHNLEGVAPHACMKKTALLLGSESHGLPEALLDLTDERWCIPGSGRPDSLSLPQAAAIMMYECTKRGTGVEIRNQGSETGS